MAVTFSISETLPKNLQLVKQGISQRAMGRATKPVTRLNPNGPSNNFPSMTSTLFIGVEFDRKSANVMVRASTTGKRRKKFYPGEDKGFVEEMRFVAMKLHTNRTVKQGEKADAEPDDDAESQTVGAWEPTIKCYLQFLVDNAEFRNTGLERSERLAKDLEWFLQQGHAIPDPRYPGKNYSEYLEKNCRERSTSIYMSLLQYIFCS